MSSLIDVYTNQKIGWRKRVGTNGDGTPSYDPPKPAPPTIINTQVTYTRRLIRNAKGEEVVSEGYLITSEPVIEGDMLIIDDREWTALSAPIIRGLLGEELHREVYL